MNYEIVVAGGGEGALTAIARVAPHWPIVSPPVVIALTEGGVAAQNVLQIVDSYASIPFKYAVHGEPVLQGQGYLCPPDKHCFIGKNNAIYLDDGNAFDTTRPSINRLFGSAAAMFGPRAIGILAGGPSKDGLQGLRDIELAGGVRILEDVDGPVKALAPRSEFRPGQSSYCVPAGDVGPLVKQLLHAARPSE